MQDSVRKMLKTIKEEIGITYKVMATKSGVSYTTVRSFMAGRGVSEQVLIALYDYAVSMEQKLK